MTPRCDGCRFWFADSSEEGSTGECRRHAPRPLIEMRLDEAPDPDTARQAVWPITFGSEWCGDFGPPPIQQTNEIALVQQELQRMRLELEHQQQENRALRQALQEAEATVRDLRRVIVDTEASES